MYNSIQFLFKFYIYFLINNKGKIEENSNRNVSSDKIFLGEEFIGRTRFLINLIVEAGEKK